MQQAYRFTKFQMRKLLDMLPLKGPDAYSNFVKVLEEDHKHIATLLTKNDDHENNVRYTKVCLTAKYNFKDVINVNVFVSYQSDS